MKGISKLLICVSLLAFTISVSVAHDKGSPPVKSETKYTATADVSFSALDVYDVACIAENVADCHVEGISAPIEKAKEIKVPTNFFKGGRTRLRWGDSFYSSFSLKENSNYANRIKINGSSSGGLAYWRVAK